MKKTKLFLAFGLAWLAIMGGGCIEDTDSPIPGCLDEAACNYNSNATVSDGNCIYRFGCTNRWASNYDPSACADDGSCIYDGKVSFWTNQTVSGPISIYVDGQYKGVINGWYSSEPPCTHTYTVVVEMPEGNHFLSATSNLGYQWSGNVNFTRSCKKFCLYL